MIIRSYRLAAIGVSGAMLALSATAHAQCDPNTCTNPMDPITHQGLATGLAPRTFSTLKASEAFCRSEPVVWRTHGGQVYGVKAKGFGTIKPGVYMCRSHAEAVARNAKSAAKPR
jgi:hypothetical protein